MKTPEMIKIHLLLLLLITINSRVLSQIHNRLSVYLHSKQTEQQSSCFTEIYNTGNTNFKSDIKFKGFPDKIEEYIIKTFDFQPEQGLYEQYCRLNGEMRLKDFEQGLKFYSLNLSDTVKLSRIPIKHFVSFFIGKNKDGQLIMIGDENNNYDFSDDKQFISKADYSELNASQTSLNCFGNFKYQYSLNGKILNRSIYLRYSSKKAIVNYYDSIEKKFYLVVYPHETKQGSFKLNGQKYNIQIYNQQPPYVLYNRENSKIYISSAISNRNKYPYTLGDTLYLENKRFLIKGVSKFGDSLHLIKLENSNKLSYGIDSGKYAFNIKAKDIKTDSIISTENFKGKLILLDFWGTWCQPCIQSIPNLKLIHEKFGHTNLAILSIAYDHSFNDVKSFIEKNDVSWINFFDPINSSTICRKFKVDTFPTFILIDEKGRILKRVTGEDSLETIKGILEKYIAQK